ncbi:MAG TPA: response regulator [Acidimicrobiales bacterium]|nr:response regulator [Acidimicrobiales bacterium]
MPAATVLVVDDDPLLVQLVKLNLELEGYNVVTASDGEEGLAQVRAQRPDLIVLDVMMPKLDGLAMTRAVKADATTRAIPIILLSAKTAANDVKLGLDAGADAYITKPFDTEALFGRVASLLASIS